jgi:hypothetical protein
MLAAQVQGILEELRVAPRTMPAAAGVRTRLFLAMACQRAGKTAEARVWLEQAAAEMTEYKQWTWTRWDEPLELEVLHREAAALLKPAKP